MLVTRLAPAPAAAAPVTVRVCDENRDWRRPSPSEMARTVWRDNRYVDPTTGALNAPELAYYTHHFLFFTTVTASGVSHALDLTGLATAHAAPCGTGPDADLSAGRAVVIWALGYHVAAADVTGSTLTLIVEPNRPSGDHGYAIVEVTRPGGSWYVRFILPDGSEVAHAASPDLCCAEEDNPDASTVLTSFMEARLARIGPAALAWVTDELRARSPNGFTGFSNPCFYRYTVEAFERPSSSTAVARVRLYTHFWFGDEMGGLPRSSTEEISLTRTRAGWRISDARGLGDFRDEPAEPHGPTTSACVVGHRPAIWLVGTLPAAGGSPYGVLPGGAAVGLLLLGVGALIRRFTAHERGWASSRERH